MNTTNTAALISNADVRTFRDRKNNEWFLAKDVCEVAGLEPCPKRNWARYYADLPESMVTTGKDLNVFVSGVPNNARWLTRQGANKVLAKKVIQLPAKKQVVQKAAPKENNATVTVQDYCKVNGLELTMEQKVLLGMKARKISRAKGRDITAKGVVRFAACERKGKTYYANKVVPAHNVMSLTEAAKEIGVLK